MQSVAYFSILLAFATLALVSSQPEVQVQPGNSASPVVESVQAVAQQQPQPQQSVVVSNAPIQVHPSQVGPEQGPVVGGPVEHHQQIHHQQQQQAQHFPGASYYAPSGLIQVVGEQQQQQVKPGQPGALRSTEQYGQPESAALPANYKPFGSWGLYIGGNPADGYYTNYYKQLGSSLEKQQQAEQQQFVKPTSALSPILKQASGLSPFAGGDYYPFAYSVNELSSAGGVSRGYVSPATPGVDQIQPAVVAHHQQPSVAVSPVQAGAQVYGSPASFEASHFGVSPYYGAESYAATKRLGSQQPSFVQQKELSKAAELPAKGYQSRVYVYPQQVGPLSAPVAFSQPQPSQVVPVQAQQQQQQFHHQQVVAYPVPVASQIVGSQAGVDGAFAPFGVHAFTRYAVKPTVVGSSEQQQQQSYHYGVSSQLPTYKQSPAAVYSSPSGHYYQPLGYYGYPLSQLHYSQGSIVPAVHQAGEPNYHGAQVEASEKSETSSSSEEKSQVNNKQQQQQKRA